jgi:carotenoid cleavage dioxygenase-like enzyme
VNPIKIPLSGRPYIENYEWKPERGTKFTLIDRRTGKATGPFETDACFGFHHVNSYEDEDGTVVADICVFDDAVIVEDLYLERLRSGKRVSEPQFWRFRIDPKAGKVDGEKLTEQGFDLPRINYMRVSERPYRYVWGVGVGESGWLDTIVRADLSDRSTTTWSERRHYPREPLFVARPGAEDEDDGVLLSVVLDEAKGSSYMLVLDARDLSELARAEAPHHIPFGFHGQFARGV